MIKNLIISFCLILSINLFSTSSYACSMGQIDEEEQFLHLQSFALNALEVDSQDVFRVTITNTELEYIWSGPLCPEGIKAAGTFQIQFVDTIGPQDLREKEKECYGIVRVVKTEPTGLSSIPIKHEIQIEILEEKICDALPGPTTIPTKGDLSHPSS